MKSAYLIPVALFLLAACDNRNTGEGDANKDTMEMVPSYGAGHEPGTGGTTTESYPQPTYQQGEEVDTLRGIHGVNVDTSANPGR